MDVRRNQINQAVKYCEYKKCRGYEALATVNRYLDMKGDLSEAPEYCSILTVQEEKHLEQIHCVKSGPISSLTGKKPRITLFPY